MSNRFSITRGNVLEFVTTPVKYNNGDLVDMTGFEAIFTVKKNKNAPDDDAIIQAAGIINNETHTVIVSVPYPLTDHPPGLYYYDITITNTSTGHRHTIAKDVFEITYRVTEAIELE